jgi:hypothetical protein
MSDIESDYVHYEIAKDLATEGRPHSHHAARSMLWRGVILLAVLFLLLAGIGWLLR